MIAPVFTHSSAHLYANTNLLLLVEGTATDNLWTWRRGSGGNYTQLHCTKQLLHFHRTTLAKFKLAVPAQAPEDPSSSLGLLPLQLTRKTENIGRGKGQQR